ncbi:hypothetical protein B1A99_11250 [Cohnella sp. CIP 111063]|uniref:SGNH/GDSL hydrolase family protein n=1 Tax=unclassified Cohnella TaxID=2636738 RepID=UPI000B8C1C77|nr:MULTISPECIES: SGNH/GDSL hydrolase family protein [unclassified Cohnella]OXS59202.1 hypothetical protein B1A99_11250 [Cohnella sp. CIP 111063]PRX72213.1 lysophospholipase L1-like esterase [Cohnella sp. SGD-V74]
MTGPRELLLRSGLPNVRDKARRGEPIAAAFLGGSITEGAGASDAEATSWRARTAEYLAERFGEGTKSVNAGVGGTTSAFGAHRLALHAFGEDEIDLLFVEFAVNDWDYGANVREAALRGMEGIVRQCRRLMPRADIVFVYAASDRNISEELPLTIAAHEEVASRYGIPSVNLAFRVRTLAEAGAIRWEELAPDRIHPNDQGYALYASTVRECLNFALSAGEEADDAAEGEEPTGLLPEPLVHGHYGEAKLLDIGIAESADGFATSDREPGALMNWRYPIRHLHADREDASLTFRTIGRGAGVVLLCGPDTGIFEYSVNGGEFREANPFDDWCTVAYRPVILLFPAERERGELRVELRNTANKDGRSAGTGLRVLGFLSH